MIGRVVASLTEQLEEFVEIINSKPISIRLRGHCLRRRSGIEGDGL